MKKIVLAAAAVPALAILAAAAVPNMAHGADFPNVRKQYSPIQPRWAVLGTPSIPAAWLDRKIRGQAFSDWETARGDRYVFPYVRIIAGSSTQPASKIRELITELKMDPNVRDMFNRTPLHYLAIVKGRRKAKAASMIAALIQSGANPNLPARDAKGTPLHWAAARNPNREIIAVLIQGGANPNARDQIGVTPLHVAALMNPKPAGVMRELLARKADPKVRDKGGNFPFDYAENRKALQGTDVYRTLKAAAGR